MANPAIGSIVAYKLAAGTNIGKLRPALVLRWQTDNTADLYVFGRPADGAPFSSGPAYVVNVARGQGNGANGTWTMLPPQGQIQVPPFPGIGEVLP